MFLIASLTKVTLAAQTANTDYGKLDRKRMVRKLTEQKRKKHV